MKMRKGAVKTSLHIRRSTQCNDLRINTVKVFLLFQIRVIRFRKPTFIIILKAAVYEKAIYFFSAFIYATLKVNIFLQGSINAFLNQFYQTYSVWCVTFQFQALRTSALHNIQ
jgi:hypothetical protein